MAGKRERTPDVSVIIPVWNAVPYLTTCVTSVLAQSLGPDRIEIIAVDDGSTDGSTEELEQLASRNPSLRVVRGERSGGPSRPRNIGLDLARGRYVFFIDADDRLAPEALERMLAYAEENDSDIVLGRIEGTGGHHTPRSMFTHDQPHADVLTSNIYRSLNAFKLMRRDFIERIGLRFIEGIPCAEDQPFMATAYFEADVISVLSNYTCLYWHQREDGGNKSAPHARNLEKRMTCPETMLPLVVERTEPGPGRDHLLSRHFGADVVIALECMLAEESPEKRAWAMELARQWLEEYYTEGVDAELSSFHRVLYWLVEQGLLDETLELLRFNLSDEEPEVLVEGGRVFVSHPFFREPSVGVPDDLYLETDRVAVSRSLGRVSWDGDVLCVEGHACLSLLECIDPQIALVLRSRSGDEEHIVDTRSAPLPEGSVATDRGAFSASIDVLSAADGGPLAEDLWDVSVVVTEHGLSRERRLGSGRRDDDEAIPPQIVGVGGDHAALVAPYLTDSFRNLSLDVGANKRVPEIARIDRVEWATTGAAALVVEGVFHITGLPGGAVRLCALGADGSTACVPVEPRADGGFVARLVLGQAADGRALEEGTYDIEIRLGAADLLRTTSVSRPDDLRTLRWWRGLVPYHAKPGGTPCEPLSLRVSRVDLGKALRRRLGRG